MTHRFDRSTRLYMIAASLFACATIIALASCGGARVSPPHIPAPAPAVGILGYIAWAATAVGGLAFIGSIIGLIFAKDKYQCIQGIIAGITLIISGQLLAWLGSHLALISVLVLVAGIVAGLVYAWIHRRSIESAFGIDIDRDGSIGDPPAKRGKAAK